MLSAPSLSGSRGKISADCCSWWPRGEKGKRRDGEGRWAGAAEKWRGCRSPPPSPPSCRIWGFFFFPRRVFRCSRRESCEMDEGEEQRGRTDEWGKKRIQINDKLTWKPRVAAQIIIVVAHSAIAEGAGGGCFSCHLRGLSWSSLCHPCRG